jgi:purine catabolism regulator
VLTVRDLASLQELELPVAAGAEGLDHEVGWLHVSELADPTKWLEGGEFLLTTGLGIGEGATAQRAYVGRLAKHGIAGLGFGVGFGFEDVPAPIVAEADKRSFPVLTVPYEVPFVAITKSAFTHLANERLEQQTRALEVHERLSDAGLTSYSSSFHFFSLVFSLFFSFFAFLFEFCFFIFRNILSIYIIKITSHKILNKC